MKGNTMEDFTTVTPVTDLASLNRRLEEVNAAIHSTRTLLWNASQMNRASAVFKLSRILDNQIDEKRALLKMFPNK
jgi:hypothetical protein